MVPTLMVKNLTAMQETCVQSLNLMEMGQWDNLLMEQSHGEGNCYLLQFLPGEFQGQWSLAAMVKNLHTNAGEAREAGSISVSTRPPGVRNGNPYQYFSLENSMDRGAW